MRLSDADLVATVTDFTAATIAGAYSRFIFPKLGTAAKSRLQIILGGGGAKNLTLRRRLAERIWGEGDTAPVVGQARDIRDGWEVTMRQVRWWGWGLLVLIGCENRVIDQIL